MEDPINNVEKDLLILLRVLYDKTHELETLAQEKKDLSAQVVEKEQTIQPLTSQVADQLKENQTLNNQLTQSQEEVLYYALSKSWRFTRPLRKIMRLIRGKKNA